MRSGSTAEGRGKVSKSFAVVYEAPADFATATELADRVLDGRRSTGSMRHCSTHSDSGSVQDHEGSLLTWKSVPGRARELGIRVRGHFDGEPGLPDARAAARAIAYVLSRSETVDAILLIRDMDDQSERREGLEQGRSVYSSATRIIIGLAVTERECWVISGFDPGDDDETASLKTERNLGFDPGIGSMI